MGYYLNPGNDKFRETLNSKIYVDKTELIAYTNSVLFTMQKNICVSRPRRFGKSVTANMLTAYYSCGCDSEEIFAGLKIAGNKNFRCYLNQYNVIFLNMQEFLSNSRNMDELVQYVKEDILEELLDIIHCKRKAYELSRRNALNKAMSELYEITNRAFIVIIDEWDCVFREYKTNREAQEKYLDFLRDMLKDKGYIHLTYMTGILPIKKYGTHSALNMFEEYSMLNPRDMAEYMGFTEAETKKLCETYNIDKAIIDEWYDGYRFPDEESVYNPRSVVTAVQSGICDTYFREGNKPSDCLQSFGDCPRPLIQDESEGNQTETFEALKVYIDLNFEGLQDAIIAMLAGDSIKIDTRGFSNDMITFHDRDDVLTLLVHLGYLGFDFENDEVFIPNREIRYEYETAVKKSEWSELITSINASERLLQAIWKEDSDAVAEGIELAHFETSHIQYNDENALSYTIALALYAAREYYTVIRELPAGGGVADVAYIPKKRFGDKPALLVELKWNRSAQGAIRQIKEKKYSSGLEEWKDNLLLIGINYDKKSRKHKCIIEKYINYQPNL